MRITYRVVSFVAAGLVASQAFAQSRVKATARVGADFGGDKVLQFQYSDGSRPSVVAGAGLSAAVGGAMELFKSGANAVESQLNLGVKYRTIPPASNQTASWVRFPVEGLLLFRGQDRYRIGGGVASHLANTLQASGGATNAKLTFKPKPGFVAQAEWLARQWSLDARYTVMNYEVDTGGSGEVSANSFGFGLSYWFGPGVKRK